MGTLPRGRRPSLGLPAENAPGPDPDGPGSGQFHGWIYAIPALAVAGVLITLIYATAVPAPLRWAAFATALAVAGAAAFVGGIIGFLFGIPRSAQRRDAAGDYRDNSNLEQVSDWLSKVIVGVGLVQIGRALPALGRLGQNLRQPLGGLPSSAAFGLAVVSAFTVLGFLFVYLWARETLPGQLRGSEARKIVDARESQERTAMLAVKRQLDAPKGGEVLSQASLNAVVAAAPESTWLQLFMEADGVRARNWRGPEHFGLDSDEDPAGRRERLLRLEQTIPVFRALIAADTAQVYHRFHGSLGFVLKDKAEPDYLAAFRHLSMAIRIREKEGQRGWRLYEACRALCALQGWAPGRPGWPPREALAEQVDADLRAAEADLYARRMLARNPVLVLWMAERRVPGDPEAGLGVDLDVSLGLDLGAGPLGG
jgi:hypothetical protein